MLARPIHNAALHITGKEFLQVFCEPFRWSFPYQGVADALWLARVVIEVAEGRSYNLQGRLPAVDVGELSTFGNLATKRNSSK